MTDRDTKADGGVEDIEELDIVGAEIEQTGSQESSWDWVKQTYDLYVAAPAKVAWNDWRARVGGLIILFYILMGTVGVVVVEAPEMNEGAPFLQPFSTIHFPLGTDQMGQSIGEQIVHATPAMLMMASAGVIFSAGFAVFLGVLSGYKGGIIDRVVMTLTDIVLTIPGLPLIIVISAIYPPRHPFMVGVILAIDNWPGLARSIRSQILTIREESYVEAARAMGISTPSILVRDIVPQIMPYVAINASTAAARVIAASAGLYFLGILPFTTLNWGVMMNLARGSGNAIADPFYTGHWLFFPALALSGLMFGLVLFSQGMDRVFNPRLRARHAESIASNDEEEVEEDTESMASAVGGTQ